jgi:hypothetical protein
MYSRRAHYEQGNVRRNRPSPRGCSEEMSGKWAQNTSGFYCMTTRLRVQTVPRLGASVTFPGLVTARLCLVSANRRCTKSNDLQEPRKPQKLAKATRGISRRVVSQERFQKLWHRWQTALTFEGNCCERNVV